MRDALEHLAKTPTEFPSSTHIGSDRVFRIVAAMTAWVDHKMIFWASDDTIAAATGYAPRDVQNAKNLLEPAGILVRTGRKRRRGAIEYELHLPGYVVHGADDGLVHGLDHGADDGLDHGLDHGADHGADHGLVHGDPRDKQNRTETEQSVEPEPKAAARFCTVPVFAPDGSKTDDVARLALENIVARYGSTIRKPGAFTNAIAAAVQPLAAQIVGRFPDCDVTTLAAWVVARNQNDDARAQQIVRRLGSMTSAGETVQPDQIASFMRDAFRETDTK